ncbi:hypothetical protein AMTR_s00134p00069500 [Amborella trichopoda]|uniref:Uncharacterized protein n=1 Tax=Amborella trichopoda TaxID=13333 RepID=W1P4W1_AMBTC|nr:hypothetical protein AMTR_s00134p00069500 [Amborella trichopoda]
MTFIPLKNKKLMNREDALLSMIRLSRVHADKWNTKYTVNNISNTGRKGDRLLWRGGNQPIIISTLKKLFEGSECEFLLPCMQSRMLVRHVHANHAHDVWPHDSVL